MEYTQGPWIDSPEAADAIISTHPDALADAGTNIGYYGGFVVCESVSRRDKPLIKAAPEMLAALEADEALLHHAAYCEFCNDSADGECSEGLALLATAHKLRRAALAKARGE